MTTWTGTPARPRSLWARGTRRGKDEAPSALAAQRFHFLHPLSCQDTGAHLRITTRKHQRPLMLCPGHTPEPAALKGQRPILTREPSRSSPAQSSPPPRHCRPLPCQALSPPPPPPCGHSLPGSPWLSCRGYQDRECHSARAPGPGGHIKQVSGPPCLQGHLLRVSKQPCAVPAHYVLTEMTRAELFQGHGSSEDGVSASPTICHRTG